MCAQLDPAQVEPVSQAMRRFVQLLSHKQFLILLVRTLDAESPRGGLSMSERLRVASLLSAFLQAKMDTYTQVLKALLEEQLTRLVHTPSGSGSASASSRRALAARSDASARLYERDSDAYQSAGGLSLNRGASRSMGSGLDGAAGAGDTLHLRTFLRRNESIAEKMLTNWLAFLLYAQLKVRVSSHCLLFISRATSLSRRSGECRRAAVYAVLRHRVSAQQRPRGRHHARGAIRARRELPAARASRPLAHRSPSLLYNYYIIYYIIHILHK